MGERIPFNLLLGVRDDAGSHQLAAVTEVRRALFRHLVQQGCAPEVNHAGTIQFRAGSRLLFLHIDACEEELLPLYAQFMAVELFPSRNCRPNRFAAFCNEQNARYKYVKCSYGIDDDRLTLICTIELPSESAETLKAFCTRAIATLCEVCDEACALFGE